MTDTPWPDGDSAGLIPLRVAAIFPTSVSLANPLLRELLAKDYPEITSEGECLRLPQHGLLWATPEGTPVWAAHIIQPCTPWELDDFGSPANWETAQEEIAQLHGWVEIVEDFNGGWYDPMRRIQALQATVSAFYRAMRPAALAWRPSRSLMRKPSEAWPVGIISIRRVGSDDATLIDSLGAAAFNLPDFQCCFSGLDPDLIVEEVHTRVLRAIEESEVIDDGDPVICLSDPHLWFTARFDESAQEPRRDVCMLIPPEDNARGPKPPELSCDD
ncbi:MAG: hypothetical protein ACRCWS_07375 [Propionibacteriaceae bacterium]